MKTIRNKNRIGIALLAISFVLIASGCSSHNGNNAPANTPSNSSSPTNNTNNSSNGNTNTQEPANSSNPYEVAGINDPEKFNEFFKTVQDLVAKDDKEKLADYVLYPMNFVTSDNKQEQIKDRADFIANYDTIFTKGIKDAIQNQKPEELFVNDKGISTTGGAVWFGVREGGVVGIWTINQSV